MAAVAREARRQRILANTEERLARISGTGLGAAPKNAAEPATSTPPADASSGVPSDPPAASAGGSNDSNDSPAVATSAPPSALKPAEHFPVAEHKTDSLPPTTSSTTAAATTTTRQRPARRVQFREPEADEIVVPATPNEPGPDMGTQLFVRLMDYMTPEVRTNKPSTVPSWVTWLQFCLVLTLLAAHFVLVWRELPGEPSLKVWALTYVSCLRDAHFRTGPVMIGLPFIGLWILGELFIFTLYRAFGPMDEARALPRRASIVESLLDIGTVLRSQRDFLLGVYTDAAFLLVLAVILPAVAAAIVL